MALIPSINADQVPTIDPAAFLFFILVVIVVEHVPVPVPVGPIEEDRMTAHIAVALSYYYRGLVEYLQEAGAREKRCSNGPPSQ